MCLFNSVDCEVLYSCNYYNGLSYCVLDRSAGVKDTAADDIQTLVVFDITYCGVQTPKLCCYNQWTHCWMYNFLRSIGKWLSQTSWLPLIFQLPLMHVKVVYERTIIEIHLCELVWIEYWCFLIEMLFVFSPNFVRICTDVQPFFIWLPQQRILSAQGRFSPQ